MRNIKFRGKIKDKKRAKELGLKVGDWVYGYFFHDEGLTFYNGKTKRFDKYYIINTPYIEEYIEIIPETLGQYTGLKDRNMKEIYEGDIVKVFTNKEWRIGKIIYEHSEFTIDVTNNKDLEYGITSIIGNLTEVIGNIYDNPELLEEGE